LSFTNRIHDDLTKRDKLGIETHGCEAGTAHKTSECHNAKTQQSSPGERKELMGAPSHAPGWTDLNRLMTCLHASYPLEFEAMVNHNSFYFKAVLQVSFLIAAVASTVLAQALSYQV
jgi:hypothetical protein